MITKTTKRALLLTAVVLAIAGHGQSASAQATTSTVNSQFPIALDVFVPCAAGGTGEFVSLFGTLHEVFHLTVDAGGAIHVKLLDQPQQVSGFGQTSGLAYQGTGGTQQMSNTNPFTFVNNFRIIGQGSDNNFLVHQLFHVTVNANGEFTAIVDFVSVDCH